MITKLLNKLNKRQYRYKTYELNNDNEDIIQQALSSPLLGEGNVSLKIVVNNGELKQFINLPIQIHLPANRIDNEYIEEDLTVYQAELNNNNFFTLNILSKNNIYNIIRESVSFTGKDEFLVFNLILKKKNKLGTLFLNQYEQFVNGVEVPSSNRIVNILQSRFIEENKIFIPLQVMSVIENKIADTHYNFQLFIGMKYRTTEKEELMFDVIQNLFDDFSHLNHFNLQEIYNETELAINSGEFLYQYPKQYISFSEVYALFHNKYQLEELNNEDVVTGLNEQETTTEDTHTESIQQPILQPSSTYALDTLPSLELLPVQIETNEDDVDHEIPDRIKNALKRVGIVKNQRVNVLDFRIGASLIKTTITIPADKNLTHITNKLKDIKAALGVDLLSIDQGDVPDSVSFFIPRTEKQPIYLRTLLENDEFIKFAENNPLPFIVGVDPLGNPIYRCMSKLVHLLVAGETGGGKSIWLNQLILTLLMLKKPSELMMYLIDPKQVELTQFEDFPQVKDVIDDMKEASKLLESLVKEMENRYSTMKEGKVKNLWDYNTKFPDKKIPFVLVVIDEYADLKMVNPSVDDLLARLGQKARAAGIHVIVATQKPTVDVIDGVTKTNLPSKISFRLDNNKSYSTVFGTGIPFNPTGKGHGVMKLNGQMKPFEQFQGAIISLKSEEEEETFEKIKKSFKGEKVEGIKVEKEVEEVKEEPIIKMKKIIAEHGETRVGKLREMMGIRTNVVQDTMRELANEGWLIDPETSNSGRWELNEECEELKKLRQMYGEGESND